jgi:multiple sugar transport system ATP-binding protein
MKSGQILQVGTPTDLYSNPNSLEVAQFIGSPTINSFKKTKEKSLNDIFLKHHLFLENSSISYLAIRAEDLKLDLNELDSCDFLLNVKLKRIENHGSEYWAYLEGAKSSDIQFICKYSNSNTKTQLSEGSNVRVGFKLKQALFFDQHQKRIRID